MFGLCSTFLKLELMVYVDVQGTSKINKICRAELRGHGQRDTQVDVFQCSKLSEAWKSKHM